MAFYVNKFAVFAQNDYEGGIEQDSCRIFQLTNTDSFNFEDIDGWFKTGILSFGDEINYKRLMKLTFLTNEACQECTLHITIFTGDTMDVSGAEENYELMILDTNRTLNLDLTARYFQIKVRTDGRAEHFELQGLLVDYTVRGEL